MYNADHETLNDESNWKFNLLGKERTLKKMTMDDEGELFRFRITAQGISNLPQPQRESYKCSLKGFLPQIITPITKKEIDKLSSSDIYKIWLEQDTRSLRAEGWPDTEIEEKHREDRKAQLKEMKLMNEMKPEDFQRLTQALSIISQERASTTSSPTNTSTPPSQKKDAEKSAE